MVHPCQSLAYKTDTDSHNRLLSPCRPPIAVRHTRHEASGYTADTEWSSHHPGTCADTLGSLSYCGTGHTGCSCSASYTQTQGWWCHSLYTSHTCEWTIRNKYQSQRLSLFKSCQNAKVRDAYWSPNYGLSGKNDKYAMHLIFLHHSPFTLPCSFGDLVQGWVQTVDVVADVTLVTQQ